MSGYSSIAYTPECLSVFEPVTLQGVIRIEAIFSGRQIREASPGRTFDAT